MIGGYFNAASSGVDAYGKAGGSFSWSDAGGRGEDNLFTGIASPSSSTSMS